MFTNSLQLVLFLLPCSSLNRQPVGLIHFFEPVKSPAFSKAFFGSGGAREDFLMGGLCGGKIRPFEGVIYVRLISSWLNRPIYCNLSLIHQFHFIYLLLFLSIHSLHKNSELNSAYIQPISTKTAYNKHPLFIQRRFLVTITINTSINFITLPPLKNNTIYLYSFILCNFLFLKNIFSTPTFLDAHSAPNFLWRPLFM